MKGARVVVIAALVSALLMPASVAAEPTEAQRLAAQLKQLESSVGAASSAYDKAHWRLDETEVRLGAVSAKERKTRARLRAVRKRLARRANALYRDGAVTYLEVLLESRSFEEMLVGLDFFQRISSQDARAIAQARSLSVDLAETRNELRSTKRRQAASVDELRRKRDGLQAQFATIQNRYQDVRAQLRRELARERAETGRTSYSFPRGPMGMVFPVQGPHSYADTWGASRSGGRRRHQGTDIMAPRGTAAVAIMSGTVRANTNGLGGKCIWLSADNGWLFYYAHLDSWVVTGGRVKAGQLIGRVGDTGNARGGAPHLHFQIHPGGGAPINPYPYLRDIEN